MSDATENSGRQLSQKPMAVYMRDRTKAKKLGLTVKQWKQAGCPGPASVGNAPVEAMAQADSQSSNGGPPGAA